MCHSVMRVEVLNGQSCHIDNIGLATHAGHLGGSKKEAPKRREMKRMSCSVLSRLTSLSLSILDD